VFAVTALAGSLAVVAVLAAALAYRALPTGRMCPQCGGLTATVRPPGRLRWLARWVQWRWCSRCGWEAAGRRGPEWRAGMRPVDHDSGFRWGSPAVGDAPIFYWRPDGGPLVDPEDEAEGFRWKEAGGGAPGAREDGSDGFRFGPPSEPPVEEGFTWKDPADDAERPSARRRWLSGPSGRRPPPPGFEWRKPRD